MAPTVMSDNSANPLLADEAAVGPDTGSKLEFVAGVIPTNKMAVFERVLWRVLRGNLFMNSAPIEEPIRDPMTDEMVQKHVFVIFAHGKEVLVKIRKISESLGASLYPVDEDAGKRREDALECQARIDDLNSVRCKKRTQRCSSCADHHHYPVTGALQHQPDTSRRACQAQREHQGLEHHGQEGKSHLRGHEHL